MRPGTAFVITAVTLGGWGWATPPSPRRALPPGAVHVAGPPAGHTGGFGEPTCVACHTEYGLNEPGGTLTLEGLPTSWAPGKRYAVDVVLRSEEMSVAGFQLAARFADGSAAGTLAPREPRVAVVDSTGVPYAQHAAGGTGVESRDIARWRVSWQAPPGAGAVTFNAAANSANGDNSPFGDLIYSVEVAVPAASDLTSPRSSRPQAPPRRR